MKRPAKLNHMYAKQLIFNKMTEVRSIKQLVITFFMALVSTTIFAQLPAELLNQEIISVNRMPMSNNVFGFENMDKAK